MNETGTAQPKQTVPSPIENLLSAVEEALSHVRSVNDIVHDKVSFLVGSDSRSIPATGEANPSPEGRIREIQAMVRSIRNCVSEIESEVERLR